MSLPVAYLPAAEADLIAVHTYYEQERAGLGDEFLDAFNQLIERICDNPQMYGVWRRNIRAAPLRRFSYVVYYRDRGSDVLVIAVQHGRRSTRAWRGRGAG